MKLKKYQIYINKLFLNKFVKVSFIFLCKVVISIFCEELGFAEKHNTKFIIQSIYLY